MADSPTFQPAPGRGQYDRRLPRERRLAEQRQRIAAALTELLARSESVSVASVVALAGVGRNTFYEYFDDVEHARRAAESHAVRRIEEALRGAEARSRTPVERWRGLARSWLEFAARASAPMLLALSAAEHERAPLSPAGRVLEAALLRSLETVRASGVIAQVNEPLRVVSVAAAGEALACGVALEALRAGPRGIAAEGRSERVLVDVAVRLLR